MQRLRLIYEQVEEAKRYMLTGHPLSQRLALILLDNAAELLMRSRLEDLFRRDERFSWRASGDSSGLRPTQPVAYSKEDRIEAEREFGGKLTMMASRLGELSNAEREVLAACHWFRGSAFHHGALHGDVLDALCRTLFCTVAAMFGRYDTTSIVWLSGHEDGIAFLRRLGLTAPRDLVERPGAAGVLRERLMVDVHVDRLATCQLLSSDLAERVDATLELLSEMMNTRDEQEIDYNLRQHEFWQDEGMALVRAGRGAELGNAFLVWNKAGRARITLGRLHKWRASARHLSRTTNLERAVAVYQGVLRRFEQFEDDVGREHADWEDMVEQQRRDREW